MAKGTSSQDEDDGREFHLELCCITACFGASLLESVFLVLFLDSRFSVLWEGINSFNACVHASGSQSEPCLLEANSHEPGDAPIFLPLFRYWTLACTQVLVPGKKLDWYSDIEIYWYHQVQ
jgi:hypothetical protein